MKTLLECLQIAADALKEGRVVKFRHEDWYEGSYIFLNDKHQLIDDKGLRYNNAHFLSDPVWEIITEPDYEGFAKAVLATHNTNDYIIIEQAKQFNIPTEEK